jgi:hypothetical protein
MTAFYIEYQNGNCTVVEAEDRIQAFDIAGQGFNPWDRISLLRPATQDDIDFFINAGGTIR